VAPRISATGAIINITTGGGLGMTFDQRLVPAKWTKGMAIAAAPAGRDESVSDEG